MVDQLRLDEAAALLCSAPNSPDANENSALASAFSAMASGTVGAGTASSTSAAIYAMCADVWNGDRLFEAYVNGSALLDTPLEQWERECCAVATAAAAAQLGMVDEGLRLAQGVEVECVYQRSPPLGLALNRARSACVT